MTTSETEQIRRQIEGTRRELSADVNALTEKVSPGRVVGRRVDRARGSLSNLKDRIMGTAHDFSGSTGSTASGVAERVSETASDAADAVRSAPRTVRRQTEGNPLAAGLVAFGAGWLVSSLLPTTRKEKELAGQATELASEHLQPVAQEVRRAATEVKENLREPAQQAAESVKSTASESGTAASTVTEEGRSAAQHVAGRADEAQQHIAGRVGQTQQHGTGRTSETQQHGTGRTGETHQHVTGRTGETRSDFRDQTTT